MQSLSGLGDLDQAPSASGLSVVCTRFTVFSLAMNSLWHGLLKFAIMLRSRVLCVHPERNCKCLQLMA